MNKVHAEEFEWSFHELVDAKNWPCSVLYKIRQQQTLQPVMVPFATPTAGGNKTIVCLL